MKFGVFFSREFFVSEKWRKDVKGYDAFYKNFSEKEENETSKVSMEGEEIGKSKFPAVQEIPQRVITRLSTDDF